MPVRRVGDFFPKRTDEGCRTLCYWNGGGYYGEFFICGETYPSGMTFYCSEDCHRKVCDSLRVFLSYRWCDGSIAEKISACLRTAGIQVLRDVNTVALMEAVSGFMDSAADSRFFVAVVTPSYFYSRNCLYEFTSMAESAAPIRTIPIVLSDALELPALPELVWYWKDREASLREAVRLLDRRFVEYLQPELTLLASFPTHLSEFFEQWHTKERRDGKHWLIANCCYLISAIQRTLPPSEQAASDWTYANPTVRFERGEDAPPAACWNRQRFHLHAASGAAAERIVSLERARPWVIDVRLTDDPLPDVPDGTHAVLIDAEALGSLSFCERLQLLLRQPGCRLMPWFLDRQLTVAGTEVGLVAKWSARIAACGDPTERARLDAMLCGFGASLLRLRDILVPEPEQLFAD